MQASLGGDNTEAILYLKMNSRKLLLFSSVGKTVSKERSGTVREMKIDDSLCIFPSGQRYAAYNSKERA